jgi:hypothetical protein
MSGNTPVGEAVTISVSEPQRLRDYFLRLGARAAVVDAGSIRVVLDRPNAGRTVSEHLRPWVAANGVRATIETDTATPAGAQPPVSEPAPPPVTGRQAAPMFFLDRPRVGDLLLRKGLITRDQLERALAESAAEGDLLGRVMIRRGFIFEDELARTLADQLELPYVDIRVAGFERSVAQLLPSADGMRIAAIPIGIVGGRIRVAFADPSDESAQELVRRHVGDFVLAVANLSDIELAWRTVDPACARAANGPAADEALSS